MGYKRREYDYDENNYWELEFYRIKAYYEETNMVEELESAKQKIEKLEQKYEDACAQLSERNNSEFYTKIKQGWKDEVDALQMRIRNQEETIKKLAGRTEESVSE